MVNNLTLGIKRLILNIKKLGKRRLIFVWLIALFSVTAIVAAVNMLIAQGEYAAAEQEYAGLRQHAPATEQPAPGAEQQHPAGQAPATEPETANIFLKSTRTTSAGCASAARR